MLARASKFMGLVMRHEAIFPELPQFIIPKKRLNTSSDEVHKKV